MSALSTHVAESVLLGLINDEEENTADKVYAARVLLDHAALVKPAATPTVPSNSDRYASLGVLGLGVAALIASFALLVWAFGSVVA